MTFPWLIRVSLLLLFLSFSSRQYANSYPHDIESSAHYFKLSASLKAQLANQDKDTFAVSLNFRDKSFAQFSGSNLHKAQLVHHNKRIANAKLPLRAFFTARNISIAAEFESLNSMFVELNRDQLAELMTLDSVVRIGTDVGGTGQMEEVRTQVGIDEVRQAYKLTGSQIEIAVLDTGIDSEHPDFSGKVLSQVCFADHCPNGELDASDDHGHGTHVSGILVGTGAIASEGMAPDARLHVIKVLDGNNSFSSMSRIVSGLDHIINHLPNVDLVNMSLGTNLRFSGHCDNAESWMQPLVQAFDILRARGVLVFVSAGNNGDNGAMQAPACVSSAVSVSAVYDLLPTGSTYFCNDNRAQANQVACFSNYSTTTDIFAPGTPIRSSWPNERVMELDGTSMSAPAVAGCAALLRSIYPIASATELESMLINNNGRFVKGNDGREYPLLNCMNVIEAATLALAPYPTLNLEQVETRYVEQELIQLSASSFDALEGDLSNEIRWYDGQQLLGQGPSLTLSMEVGSYQIAATVTNRNSKASKEVITLEVFSDASPHLNVVSSQNDVQTAASSQSQFEAIALDEFDGDISHQVEWYLQDKKLQVGRKLSHRFSPGEHILRVQVVDTHGNQVKEAVTVSVAQAPQDEEKNGGGLSLTPLLWLVGAIWIRRYLVRAKPSAL